MQVRRGAAGPREKKMKHIHMRMRENARGGGRSVECANERAGLEIG